MRRVTRLFPPAAAVGATAPGQTISEDVIMIYVLPTIWAEGVQPNLLLFFLLNLVRRVVNIKDRLAVCIITEVLPRGEDRATLYYTSIGRKQR